MQKDSQAIHIVHYSTSIALLQSSHLKCEDQPLSLLIHSAHNHWGTQHIVMLLIFNWLESNYSSRTQEQIVADIQQENDTHSLMQICVSL